MGRVESEFIGFFDTDVAIIAPVFRSPFFRLTMVVPQNHMRPVSTELQTSFGSSPQNSKLHAWSFETQRHAWDGYLSFYHSEGTSCRDA